MNRPRILFVIVAAVVAGGAIFAIISNSTHRGSVQITTTATPGSIISPGAMVAASPPNAFGSIQPLNEASKELLLASDSKDSQKILGKLRAYLLSLPKSVATQLIAEFLNQKSDAGTKLEFSVDKNGLLSGAPTLRIFLLDLLEQIDPAAASQCAMQILSTPGSPDEWAVSLRNYARYDTSPAGQSVIREKIQEMLSNASWRKDPSVGFLEAFDTIVYSHDTSLTPTLAAMVSDPNDRAVAHAAYLALDRLTIQDTVAVLTQLEAEPSLMQGHELTRANYFARADIAVPDQRSLVESYLLNASHTPQELNTFAGLFPNENFMLSNNLLTQNQTPTGLEIAQRDRAALQVVQNWLADPRFQPVLPQLQTIQKRLQIFVNQANAQSSQ